MKADEESLEQVFRSLGADTKQAKVMAKQTLKRVSQLVDERGMDEESALKYLLQMVVSGRSGETCPIDDRNKENSDT